MRIQLNNVGPVRKADVSLSRMTILIGENGSGKTTVSSVLYAAMKAQRAAVATAHTNVVYSMRQALAEDRDLDDLGPQLVESWRTALKDEFESELRRCFGSDLSTLARFGRVGAGSAPRISIGNGVRGPAGWHLTFRLKKNSLIEETDHNETVVPDVRALMESEGRKAGPIADLRRAGQRLNARVPRDPVYLPAARSGFVQMQDALSALLFGALGQGYFEHATVGKVSGIASDFLRFLTQVDPDNTSDIPAALVQGMERAVLHGTVTLQADGPAKSVHFTPDGIDHAWPMDAVATSVAELAPLAIYLRHYAAPYQALFFDEPEAHFHPLSQLDLAEWLLKISLRLRGMVLGTHSDFFASGLSNALMQEIVDEPEVKAGPANRGVALYEFRRITDASIRGYDVHRTDFDAREGFDIQQFSRVSETAIERSDQLFNSLHES